MKYLVMWLITVMASFGMELSNELRYLKDVADNGYKIDINKLKELKEKMNIKTPSLARFLIPIYNMMIALQNTMKYSNNREMFLTELSVFDCLEEMSEYEKKEYAKKPTGLNAILVPFKVELKAQKAIRIENKQDGNIIYFELDVNKNIVIIKTIGPVSKLNHQEQVNAVNEALNQFKQNIENIRKVNQVLQDVEKDDIMNIGNSQNGLTFSKTQADIIELEKLKHELLDASLQEKDKVYKKNMN